MKRRKLTRVISISAALLFVLFFSGCDFFAAQFDPLIGTWEVSTLFVGVTETDRLAFHADLTSEMNIILSDGVNSAAFSLTGTYVKDDAAKTITFTWTTSNYPLIAAPQTVTDSFEISADKKSLTLVPEGGAGTTFTRI